MTEIPLSLDREDKFPPFGEDQGEIDDQEQWIDKMDYETFLKLELAMEEELDDEEDEVEIR